MISDNEQHIQTILRKLRVIKDINVMRLQKGRNSDGWALRNIARVSFFQTHILNEENIIINVLLNAF